MRKFVVALFVSVVLLATSSAHSGKTDSAGGHTNHSTGEYHYHHGDPAHQHIGGVCPYDKKKESTSISVAKQKGKITIGEYAASGAVAAGFAYLYFKRRW